MIKKTIDKTKYDTLAKYKKLTKQVNALKTERDEILKELFENSEDNIVAFTVRGEGIAFLVEKQTSNSVSWKGLASDNIDEELIKEILPEYTKPYDKFLVKI